ncbi:XRCC6 [Symbiodinium sp. CCMP2456]|nr:XRCC6 [Symbiodinium sp. CCMP2456]
MAMAKLSEEERQMVRELGWPVELLEDPRKQPRLIDSPEEFARALLLEDHLEDIVILQDGLKRAGLAESEALPPWLSKALDSADGSVLQCLRQLEPAELAAHKAALEFPDDRGVQREALPRPYPFCLWDDDTGATKLPEASALPEAWRDLSQRLVAAEALKAKGELDESHLYVCELRRLRKRTANDAAAGCGCKEPTKSLSQRHARDWFGELSRWTLYWNCYDDGIFIGGRGSGKGLHVDQVLWSNIGKQWRGYKLMVTWPAGVESTHYVRELSDAHFRPPLGEPQLRALRSASRIALLRPGDLFICSGGVAHATLSASEDVSVTGYESLVSLHPRLVAHLLETGSVSGPCALDKGVMEGEELRELRVSLLQRLMALLKEQTASKPISEIESAAPFGVPLSLPCMALRQQLASAASQVAADPNFAVLAGGAGVCRLLAGSACLNRGKELGQLETPCKRLRRDGPEKTDMDLRTHA